MFEFPYSLFHNFHVIGVKLDLEVVRKSRSRLRSLSLNKDRILKRSTDFVKQEQNESCFTQIISYIND